MDDGVEPKRDSNKRLMVKLLAFALGSFAFGFALVPFYDVLCDITGFGNQKALAEARVAIGQPDDSRTITVDFIADLPSVGNWEFRPTVASMQVHPGRLYKTEFFAHNLTGHETMAQAVPNIAPGKAAGFFARPSASASRRSISPSTSSGPWPCASWSIRPFRARSTASRFRTLFMTSSPEWAH